MLLIICRVVNCIFLTTKLEFALFIFIFKENKVCAISSYLYNCMVIVNYEY